MAVPPKQELCANATIATTLRPAGLGRARARAAMELSPLADTCVSRCDGSHVGERNAHGGQFRN